MPSPLYRILTNRSGQATLTVIGILIFAQFIHTPWPWKWIALLSITGSASVIGYSLRASPLLRSVGILPLTQRVILYMIPALTFGVGFGVLTRWHFDMTLLPTSLGRFVCAAPLIGMTEEMVFRGYIQAYVRPNGRWFSILFASASHAAYKAVVIASLPSSLHFHISSLAGITFAAGILFGILRERSESTLPPLFAHALYDIVVYGGASIAPVWVWS